MSWNVRELTAAEYLGIEQIIRDAKGIEQNEALEMAGSDFAIGLLVACVKKDGKSLSWDEVANMPAKLFQALRIRANNLNVLTDEEARTLFLKSSMDEAEPT